MSRVLSVGSPPRRCPLAGDRRAFLRAAALSSLSTLLAPPRPALAGKPVTAVFHDPACLRHDPGEDHRERPARLAAVMDALSALSADPRVLLTPTSRMAGEADLRLVHDPGYVALARREVTAGERMLSTGDTRLSPGAIDTSLAAVGTVLTAIDAVVAGRARNAFCAVRPPGHHTSAARGMGFGIFNAVAIGTRYAQKRHGIGRVLIVDWDVHHGNGTQDVFWRDGSVLFFDTHQHPWYPGTGTADEVGEGRARGLVINRPLPAGAGRTEILDAYREALVPVAEKFRPELVMISAGFDSRRGDPLGRFTLDDEDFAELTRVVLAIAAAHCNGRVVSVLEGGYALEGLASASAAHVKVLAGE